MIAADALRTSLSVAAISTTLGAMYAVLRSMAEYVTKVKQLQLEPERAARERAEARVVELEAEVARLRMRNSP